MGAGPDDFLAEADEKPQHEVVLDAYWIGRTEVTNAQFERFVAAEGSNATSWRRANSPGGDRHPAASVSWTLAMA